jgi:uncharacterized protein
MAGAPLDPAFRFVVRLTPKGGRNAVEGWAPGSDGKPYLKARVSAPPEDGKANEALVQLLAKTLDVGKTKVRIVAGMTSRMKIVEVAGDRSRLAALGWLP